MPRDRKAAGSAHVCIEGVENEALLFLLDRGGVCASAASACSSGAMEPSHVLAAMGVPRTMAAGALRLSLGWASEADEIDRVLEVLPAAVARLRPPVACDGRDVNVLVAMSGGVDSSVAAAELLDAGHDVVGVTMKLWGGDSDTGCCSVADVDDARRVAQQLGIDHLVFNFGDDFEEHVVAPYLQAHVAGATPNPCIECNRHLKFARLADRADLLGFDAVATGHHARVVPPPSGSQTWRLARGADRAKDQSYVLHMLGQRDLRRALFPVGAMTKDEVRRRAASRGLRTAAKADSQDVCFITTARGRSGFVGSRVPLARGGRCRHLGTQGRAGAGGRAGDRGPAQGRRAAGRGRGPLRRRRRRARGTGGGRELEGAAGRRPARGCLHLGRRAGRRPDPGPVQRARGGSPGGRSIRAPRARSLRWLTRQRRVAPGQSVVFYDPGDEHVLGGGIAA